jgi:hypothetical protein
MVRYVGNEDTRIVHDVYCAYSLQILNAVEFEDLYDALGSGYCEGGCCLTDRPYNVFVLAKEKRKAIRQKIASECLVCGESRCVEMAHIVPRSVGGALTMPLCPTCHNCYDEGILSEDELEALLDAVNEYMDPRSARIVEINHGRVAQLRGRKAE